MPTGLNVLSTIAFLFYLALFVVFLVNAIAPKWWWRTFDSWKATEEPSKIYFLTKRIVAIVGAIVIAASVFLPIFIAHFYNA